jgi:hypothetical protein
MDCGANRIMYYDYAPDTKFRHGYDIEERTCADFCSYLERGTEVSASSQEENIASPFYGANLTLASADAVGKVRGFPKTSEISGKDKRLHTESRHILSNSTILPANKTDQRVYLP